MSLENENKDLGIKETGRKRIVIIGGGFAGLHLIRGLQKSNYQVILLDRKNHHAFQHLLYQVATSELESGAIAYPLRKLLRNHPDFHFRMVKVKQIDSLNNKIITNYGILRYDYLVIATGSNTNFFGMDSVARNSLPLKNMGVKVITQTQITSYDGQVAKTDKGDFPTKLLLWSGGVSGAFIAGFGKDLVNKKGRIKTDQFGRVKGHENIFALGDVAKMSTQEYPGGYPQLAAVAVQQGKYLAGHFMEIENKKNGKPFHYSDRGIMVNIGRNKGIMEFSNGWSFKGFIPWLGWLAVHLFFLTGVKNKMVTFVIWVWVYISRDMAARVIIEKQDD